MARDTLTYSTRRSARHARLAWRFGVIAALLLLAACSPAPTTPTATATVAMSAPTSSGGAGSGAVNLSALPLGDGHVGSRPQVGWVDACQTNFPSRGGAAGSDPWIHGATWSETAKIAVEGSVRWPQASYSMQVTGGQRVIVSNDLPVGYPTGTFPIQTSDPAYQLDRNPNSIQPQSIHYSLPANPTLAPSPTCVGMGPIGILTDGVLFFNALDAEGRDAQAHEVQDRCGGHPQMNGMYHYHGVSSCLMPAATGPSTLVGYALDGFGIYVEHDANGALLTDADLDACHGRTSVVTWDGKQVNMYHYDATAEYPYTVGCFMGAPIRG